MRVSRLPWAVKVETARRYVFLSIDIFGWNIIHFTPSVCLDMRYWTGNVTLSLSFLNIVAVIDVYRKDKFQA